MDTGKQINAMVVVVLLTVISIGFYALFDPFRADTAEEDQLDKTAERAAHTFALNCRLCHGDRGEGGAEGGRLPAAPALDRADLQGFEMGSFSVAAFNDDWNHIFNTISCGRAGTFMPTWGREYGGTLSAEQIRQLTVLITGGDAGADPLHQGGFWELAQHAADEEDANATEHSTLQMPNGSLSASATEITVSNAAPLSVDQYIRIDEERMQIVGIPTTDQRLVQEVGREPDELYVSGADGIETGDIIRLDGELMEVTGIRADGDLGIELDAPLSASSNEISVNEPAFFGLRPEGKPGYTVHADGELIEVVGPVETDQLLGTATGRAQTTIDVTGTVGIEVGMRIRMGSELLEVLEVHPATVEVMREASDSEDNPTLAGAHESGTDILELVEPLTDEEIEEGAEPDDPETGQFLLEPLRSDIAATTMVVSGTSGISIDGTYQIDNELVLVTDVQQASLRVRRGVGGTEAAAHSRRVPIYEDNFLEVERGVLGTSASDHDAGTTLLFDVLEVEREVGENKVEDHAKNAELHLGHVVEVERGALDTEPVEHANGTLVLNFPPPPDEPAVTGATCGQNPPVGGDGGGLPMDDDRDDAPNIGVSLVEYSVTVDAESAEDGTLDWDIANDGTTVHNFRIVATDLAPDALPQDGDVVDEGAVDVVGGFESALPAGQSAFQQNDLDPGSYVLICNVPTHYGLGMYTSFEVTAP